MSVSLYQAGMSGLLAAQQQLATTGNNIANVNTEGYTRQRADQGTSLSFNSGRNSVGTGTYVQDISRLYDKFSFREQLITLSTKGNADSMSFYTNQLNQVMKTSGDSVIKSMERFYTALNGIADNPNETGNRKSLITQAARLSNDFNTMSESFGVMTNNINGEIEQITDRISEISVAIAGLNQSIIHSPEKGGAGQPNDLLDKRDKLINELAEYTDVSTIEDANGVMTVMIGQGTTLVAGVTPLTMQVKAGSPDRYKTEIQMVSEHSQVSIDGSRLGGSLAANLDFRDNDLVQVKAEINRLAMAVSATLNDSQSSGLDLHGLQGANIFTDINTTQLEQGRVLAHSGNTGGTQAKITITDVSKLPTDEFEVRFEFGIFTLHNLTSGDTENLGAAGTGVPAGEPLGTHTSLKYGFSFVETGVPAAGDTFSVIPTRNSASLMEVTLTDGSGIAASTAIGVTASTNNKNVGKVVITDVTNPVAAEAYKLTVDVYQSPAPAVPGASFDYRIYDPASPPPAAPLLTGTYAAGASAIVDIPVGTPDFQIEISGDLFGSGTNARETFSLGSAYGVGNGNNAVSMAKTQEVGVTNGGKETFSKSLAITTSVVGSKASNAELTAETAQALFTQAYNRNQSTSGVNLDEEAANLLKFQQAYQAASQIISTANTIFDTILAAVR